MLGNTELERVSAFTAALLAVDRVRAGRALAAAGSALPPIQMVEQIVVPALDDIGRAWEAGEVALSQVYMSARICEELVAAVPELAVPFRRNRPRIAIAALEDYHLLGKSIVVSLLRTSGFAVADYGVADAVALADRACAERVDALLVSVLMLRSALRVVDVRTRCEQLGYRPRLVVGGAPFRFDDRLWQEVGADAWGRTASDAVRLMAEQEGAPP